VDYYGGAPCGENLMPSRLPLRTFAAFAVGLTLWCGGVAGAIDRSALNGQTVASVIGGN
jgi:hypothetical protein